MFFVEALTAFMEKKAEESGKPASELPVSFYIGLKRGKTMGFIFVAYL
jgi:hypothetical protein